MANAIRAAKKSTPMSPPPKSGPELKSQMHLPFLQTPTPLQLFMQGMVRQRMSSVGQLITPSYPGIVISPPMNGQVTGNLSINL